MNDNERARELLQEAMTALVEGEYHEQVDAYEKIRVFLSSSESKESRARPLEPLYQLGIDREHGREWNKESAARQEGAAPAAVPEFSEEEIQQIRACLDDGSYTRQEQRDFNLLCDMALRALRGKE